MYFRLCVNALAVRAGETPNVSIDRQSSLTERGYHKFYGDVLLFAENYSSGTATVALNCNRGHSYVAIWSSVSPMRAYPHRLFKSPRSYGCCQLLVSSNLEESINKPLLSAWDDDPNLHVLGRASLDFSVTCNSSETFKFAINGLY